MYLAHGRQSSKMCSSGINEATVTVTVSRENPTDTLIIRDDNNSHKNWVK
jgi:hypothetical protein